MAFPDRYQKTRSFSRTGPAAGSQREGRPDDASFRGGILVERHEACYHDDIAAEQRQPRVIIG